MKSYKMLIALAGSPDAEKVASAGLAFGKPLNAEIALLSIVKPTRDVSDDGTTEAEISEEFKINYEKSLAALTEKIFKDYGVKSFVKVGKPYAMILKTAIEWEADVIVMGIHSNIENSEYGVAGEFGQLIKRSAIPLILVPAKSLDNTL